jgi:hypothetical protein
LVKIAEMQKTIQKRLEIPAIFGQIHQDKQNEVNTNKNRLNIEKYAKY